MHGHLNVIYFNSKLSDRTSLYTLCTQLPPTARSCYEAL